MKKWLKLIQEYWQLLTVASTGFWLFAVAIYNALVLPNIDAHIDSRVLKMAKDSLGVMIDAHLSTKGGGFRGELEEKTGISKDNIADTVAYYHTAGKYAVTQIRKNTDFLEYQHGINNLMIKSVFLRTLYGGVVFYTSVDGDYYYLDASGLLWSALYVVADDCFYYFPKHADGARIKCE